MAGRENKNHIKFTLQPNWDISRLRRDIKSVDGEGGLHIKRYRMNSSELECYPGVGQCAISFPVHQKDACSFTYGVLSKKDVIPNKGLEDVLQVSFSPALFTHLTGVSAADVSPYGEDTLSIFPWSGEIIDAINETDAENEQLELLHRFIKECQMRQRARRNTMNDLTALSVAGYMLKNDRLIRMDELEQEFNYSAKTLQNIIRERVGIPPKQLNLQICFQSAMQRMQEGKVDSVADLSYQLGFYDQSHFDRVFRKMSGDSPAGFLGKIK